MNEAKLKKHIKWAILGHSGRELWSCRPNLDYNEGLEPLVDELVDIAAQFKKSQKYKDHSFDEEIAHSPTILEEIIGKKLKKLRLAKGLSELQVARRADLNINYYKNIERGEPLLRLSDLKRALEVLDVQSSFVLPF